MKFFTTLLHRLTRIRGHYGFIFTSLLLVFALHPFVEQSDTMTWILEAMYGITVLAILLSTSTRHGFFVLLGLGIAVLLAAALDHATAASYTDPLSKVIRLLFFVMVIVSIFRDLLRRRRVDFNTVLGASCVYLFMVLAWSSIFYLVEWGYPDSFNLSRSPDPTQVEREGVETQLVYFSLITMTTVGYGDITPITPQARILSGIEGLIGQLFLAIVIARVVGMELAHRQHGGGRAEGEDP